MFNSSLYYVLSAILISFIGFWVGKFFSSRVVLPPQKAEFKLKDALKALTNGQIEIWEQFKLFNEKWDKKITNYDFSNCNLSGINFKGVAFQNVKFIDTNLDFADFSNASIKGGTFDKASLRNSNFSNSSILGSSFKSSLLNNSDINNCNLKSLDFEGADLGNVIFNYTKGTNIILKDAKIKRASFDFAKIEADTEIKKEESIEPISIQNIIKQIYREPLLIYSLNPMIMEDVITEIFLFKGYLVQKTSMFGDDRGYDLILSSKTELDEIKYFVEVKRYSPNNKGGEDLIRIAYGILKTQNVTGFIIVTTSSFTQAAIGLSKKINRIKLVDSEKLFIWIRDYFEQKITNSKG